MFLHLGQMGAVPNRSLLCEAFDGFSDSSKTTGMYEFSIANSRLSLLGASTGGSLYLLLARYSVHKIADGCENRFLYHFIENNLISYDMIKKCDKFLPSMEQLFVIIHLIGHSVYTFVDELGNDEAQRFYVTKGGQYIEEGRRLFKNRQQPHLQSFYSKSAEIFPKLCVAMQRFLDAMVVLFDMNKNRDLEYSQVVDQRFITLSNEYIKKNLVFIKNANGTLCHYIKLETCQITSTLFDNYLFKNTLNLFNLEQSSLHSSMPCTQFRTLIAEKPSIEKRILQLPFHFFLPSDLKQPTMNDYGKKINAPFHHVDSNTLNNVLNQLVEQKLLSVGKFISRPRGQPTSSYMKNPIPTDPIEQEEFIRNLLTYKINPDEYSNLLQRSKLPSRCVLLSEAQDLLISKIEHLDDCLKYGLVSTGTQSRISYVKFCKYCTEI